MKQDSHKSSLEFTRRDFLKTSGAAVATLAVAAPAFAAPKTERLAVRGGPKTVTVPEAEQTALTRWPRYGEAEKQAVCAMLESNRFYEELPLFEKEWKDYTGAPFVKAHMNGSSALTSMYFALDLPPAWIDPDQIERVLMNILYNAYQAMPDGGPLHVETGLAPDGQQLFVAVTDAGCGIPRENLEHLFDPFFTTRERGTGLGLAIAYEIIQAHGGNIEVESAVGRGTTFRFYVPAKKGGEASAATGTCG